MPKVDDKAVAKSPFANFKPAPHRAPVAESDKPSSSMDAASNTAPPAAAPRVARKRVLAVASRGGHWIQLLRLSQALSDADVTYVTTVPEYRSMVEQGDFRKVIEANRTSKVRMLILAAQIFWIVLRIRPNVIITTGAAPGYFAVRCGRWFGAKTMWIDSIANAEELSLSGRLASQHADVVLTQWSHLASEGVAQYRGAVI